MPYASPYSTKKSKHILNAQAAIRAPCCQKWFDCPECHAEVADHPLRKTTEMVFMCKKCRKAFRKDMTQFEESDEYCPHCDNHFVRMIFSTTGSASNLSLFHVWRSSKLRPRRLSLEWKGKTRGRTPGECFFLVSTRRFPEIHGYLSSFRMLRDERMKRLDLSLDDEFADLLEPWILWPSDRTTHILHVTLQRPASSKTLLNIHPSLV